MGCLQSTSIGTVEEVPSSGCNATKCLSNSERAECSPKTHETPNIFCILSTLLSFFLYTLQSYSHSADVSTPPGMRQLSPSTSLCAHCTFPTHGKLCPQIRLYVTTSFVLIPGMVCYYIFPLLNIA